MLRVAAAESPGVKWGGLDISAYEAGAENPGQALEHDTTEGDVFGMSRQVSTHQSLLCNPSQRVPVLLPEEVSNA